MNEKLMSTHKNLYRNVYRSFIHNGPKLEATNIFFYRQADKTDCGISIQWTVSVKKNWALNPWKKKWRNIKCILLGERSQSGKATCSNSYHITFWEKAVLQRPSGLLQWLRGAWGWGEGGKEGCAGRVRESFRGGEWHGGPVRVGTRRDGSGCTVGNSGIL